MIEKLTFKKAKFADKEIIFSWLAEPHVQAFWDNSQAHKNDIINWMSGRTRPSNYCDGKYIYWIASADNKPYAMLMTIQETLEDDIGELKLSHLSKTGHTYGLDFMIGNIKYLGRGYGARTLVEFIDFFRNAFDEKADTFLIDPATDNPRARHVYEKAGFTYVADFIMSGNVSGAGKAHSLLIKKCPPNVTLHQVTNDVAPITQKMARFHVTAELAKKLIATQFPEYAHLKVSEVEQQGQDNRTYRVGNDMLIRLPTAAPYALKVPKEQTLLPKLANHVSVAIPTPIKMGSPSADYPYPFSIYKWIEGRSANHLQIDDTVLKSIALQLANFLKELQGINDVDGPEPGQHNWWRGAGLHVYDQGAREQISHLSDYIDSNAALDLWERASATKWDKKPVWIHGDFATGNILIKDNNLSGVIDFGGVAVGDPACDLVIAWTYLTGDAREVFINEINLDANTWLRSRVSIP